MATGKLNDQEAIALYKDIIELELSLDHIVYGTEPRLRAIHVVARAGDMELMRALLRKGAGVNFCTSKGLSPLHYAVLSGKTQMIQLLVLYGAQVNAESRRDGRTPLFSAVERGDLGIVQALLENGANPDIRPYGEVCAKDFATAAGFHEIAQMINDYQNGRAPIRLGPRSLAQLSDLSPVREENSNSFERSDSNENDDDDPPPSYEEVMNSNTFDCIASTSFEDSDTTALLGDTS